MKKLFLLAIVCAVQALSQITSIPTAAGGGSGATAVTGLTDCKATVSGDIITVAACRVYGLGSSYFESFSMSAGTVTRSSGAESGNIYIVANYGGGSPVFKAIIATSITLGNYASSGVTRVSANAPEAGDKLIALVVASSGVLGAPTDYRGLLDVGTYTQGTGITVTGRTVAVNSSVVPLQAGATVGMPFGSVASDPSAPSNGDCWYDTTQTRFECRENGTTKTMIGGSGGATIYSGTYATWAGPQSCATGDMFLFEDSTAYTFSRCTATNTWGKIYADGKTITQPPATGSFTAVTTGSSGTASVNSTGGSLNFLVGDGSAIGVSDAYTKALANGTTFTLTIGVKINLQGSYNSFAIGLSTGTGATADQQTFIIGSQTSSGVSPGTIIANYADWAYSSGTAAAATYGSGMLYFRIKHASGTRTYEISSDRNNWSVVTSTTTTTYITPTHYYMRAAGTGTVTVFHLEEI